MSPCAEKSFKELLDIFFACPDKNGGTGYPDNRFFEFLSCLSRDEKDPVRCAVLLNAMEREFPGESFYSRLRGEIFDAVVKFGVLPAELSSETLPARAEFLVSAACELFNALAAAFAGAAAQSSVVPGAAEKLIERLRTPDCKAMAKVLLDSDPFAGNRVFRWYNGTLHPVKPDAVKPVKKFFGFAGVRHIFSDHFRDFATSRSNVPLLIYSLPGYGKTSMTLSHALNIQDSVVILPDPEDLNGRWINLVSKIAGRKDHKFIIFFDDIDPSQADWYSFRTHVGGVFSMPDNVMPVLSSNYEFPAGILSRGRKVSYPVFDEVRCTEMIEDFLLDFGLKRPLPQLISLIGADYTEEFGQKKFTELSPRTLMRYLQIYMQDKNKRRTMVEMSMGEMVTRPDAKLFYEFNINLMRDLYGEEYIKRLCNEKLKNL